MKKHVSLIAMMLALITLLFSVVSCAETVEEADTTVADAETNAPAGNGDSTEAETTAEETLFAPDDLEEKYDFNETVTVLMWDDYRMTEFYAEENGDLIADSIYHRNVKVCERLGITLEFVEEPGDSGDYKQWIQKAENDRAADNDYDIYAGYSRSAPLMALKGMNANLLDYEVFNVDKPWWPEALTSECTVNDKLYFCTGDIATSMLWYMNGFMYNKDLYKDYISSERTPMDMVLDNEWTMDIFFGMVKDLYVDNNQDGTKDKTDFFGATMYSTDLGAFQIGSGITSLEKGEDGNLRISEQWNSQRCSDICALLGSYIQQPGVYAATSASRTPFFNQTSIFHMDRIFLIKGVDNGNTEDKVTFTCGVVPVPKYDNSQEKYRTNLGNPYTIYAVNASSKIAEIAVTTLEAMGSENYRSVTPAVFEVAMKVRYSDDAQTSQVFDILKEGVSFDLGKLYGTSFGDVTSNLFPNTANSANYASFLSQLKKSERIINKGIKDLMEVYGK